MKVQCKTTGYHPATKLDLVEGEMDVADEAVAELLAAGLIETQKVKRAHKPEKEE